MDDFYLLIASLFAVSGSVAALYVITFLRKASSSLGKPLSGSLPKAVVVLCLRGADPFLPDTLKSVLLQNYPHFTVKLMIDNEKDPSVAVVKQVIQEVGATNVQVSFLKTVRKNCSLKCSSLVQAISEVDPSYEVAAFVDADIICYPHWLKELVLPLHNPDIGVTTGNRWYLWNGKFWGSRVRYIWNLYCALQMIFHQCPWGGSFAIRIKTLKETGLLDKWALAFCEDVMMRDVLYKFGLRVHFVPALMMLNTEEVDLRSFVTWIQRQFLCVRLYFSHWPYGVAENILILLPHVLLTGRILLSLLTGQLYKALATWCVYSVLLGVYAFLILAVMEPKVQEIVAAQGRPMAKVDGRALVSITTILPVSAIASFWALLVSCTLKAANWRGVHYQIQGPFQIQLVQYKPYEVEVNNAEKKSL